MKKKEDNGYKKISVIHKGQGGSSVFLAIDSKKNVLTYNSAELIDDPRRRYCQYPGQTPFE